MADRTQGNIRFGWGPSALASPEEKEAYRASQISRAIERGEATIADLPEAYGGRPTGTTRRAMRMQAEWDARQAARIQEEKQAFDMRRQMEQMTLQTRQAELAERSQILEEQREARLQAAEAKAQEETLKIGEQADAALNEVLGGFDASGAPIAGLNPDAPDYMQRRNDIIKRYPKALQDDAFKTTIATTDKSYFDKLNFNQQLKAQEESSGRIVERQVAAEERVAEKQRGIREEERKAQEENQLVSQEREIDKAIRSERQKFIEFQNQKTSPSQQKSIQASQNKLLDLRIEKAALRDLVFEDQESYKKALEAGKTFPSGTIIYIGRKPVKVK